MAIYRIINGVVVDVNFTGYRVINGMVVQGQAAAGEPITIEVPSGGTPY